MVDGASWSAPRLFGPGARLLQGRQGGGHLVALQLDHAVLEGAAGACAGFELFEQGLQFRFGQLQAGDGRHELAALARLGALHPLLGFEVGACGVVAEFLPAAFLSHAEPWTSAAEFDRRTPTRATFVRRSVLLPDD